jgi:hypothetical protein
MEHSETLPTPGDDSRIVKFDPAEAVAAIHKDSVYFPVSLKGDAVERLRQLALTNPIQSPHSGTPLLGYEEALEYNLRRTLPHFLYGSVPAAEADADVQSIVNDPLILETARQYLGYLPNRRRLRLQWSFVCDADAKTRQARGQTVFYHYDVDDFNFVYIMFYLTDVDAGSGAHVMIPATHKEKPVSWLLGKTWFTDEEVFAVYPRSREIMIAGRAGSGFIQDSSCMHKAMAPTERPRLVLQIRYS